MVATQTEARKPVGRALSDWKILDRIYSPSRGKQLWNHVDLSEPAFQVGLALMEVHTSFCSSQGFVGTGNTWICSEDAAASIPTRDILWGRVAVHHIHH